MDCELKGKIEKIGEITNMSVEFVKRVIDNIENLKTFLRTF